MSFEGYIGDFPDNATFSWPVPLFASGVLLAPVGLTLAVYKDANPTQTTTGVTVPTTSFDGLAGIVLVTIDTSDAFYTTGSEFHVIATAGTLEGTSLIGRGFLDFSIERTGGVLALTKARLPAALISGRMAADVEAINDSTEAAQDLRFAVAAVVRGAAIAGTLSTTQMTTDLTEVTDNHYNGRIVIWTSGGLKDQATDVSGYLGATKRLTFTATTEAPAVGDTFVLV